MSKLTIKQSRSLSHFVAQSLGLNITSNLSLHRYNQLHDFKSVAKAIVVSKFGNQSLTATINRVRTINPYHNNGNVLMGYASVNGGEIRVFSKGNTKLWKMECVG